MKIDNEAFTKNQFWIMFGVLVPLIFFTMIWLTTVAAGRNEEEKKALEKHKQALDELVEKNKPAGKLDIDNLLGREKKLEERKIDIWKKAWEVQKELLTWPGDLQKTLGDLTFGDPIDTNICAEYARLNNYNVQVDKKDAPDALINYFKTPTLKVGLEERAFESIQYKGGLPKVVTYVKDWASKGRQPSSEEVWLAQEDFWVQREVLRAIREANQTVATFKKVEGPADLKQGELFRQHFENAQWHIDLILAQKQPNFILRGRIKNISGAQLLLGRIYFKVQLHNDKTDPIVLPIEGDQIPAGKDIAFADFTLDLATQPDGLLALAQLYETRDSPIRRIDKIVLGAQTYRTFDVLKMHKMSQSKEGEAAAAAPPMPTDGPKPPAMTDFGLIKERYCDITEQVRRLPFAVVVLVDQGHMGEILTSLANSRLRLQITQVSWHHFRDRLDDLSPPRDPSLPAVAPKRDEQTPGSNLVEMTVYCIASLYERYPPKNEAGGGKN